MSMVAVFAMPAQAGIARASFHQTNLVSDVPGMANITELATGYPGYNAHQPQDKAAVAAVLHQHGYTSFALGKWHNTPATQTTATTMKYRVRTSASVNGTSI